MTGVALGRVGIWSMHYGADRAELRDVAAELEELGYGSLWYPNRPNGFDLAAALLDATHEIVAASGIVSIWDRAAGGVARAYGSLSEARPDRFLLGLGGSHAEPVDRAQPGRYRRPPARMREYLDALTRPPHPVPRSGRMLGALGPCSPTSRRRRPRRWDSAVLMAMRCAQASAGAPCFQRFQALSAVLGRRDVPGDGDQGPEHSLIRRLVQPLEVTFRPGDVPPLLSIHCKGNSQARADA